MIAEPAGSTQLRVDTSRWPRVYITYAGHPDDAELEAHLEEIEQRILSRREPFVMLIDQRLGAMPDAAQRAMIAEHQNRNETAYLAYCRGEAYLVSPRLRGAMIAVFWQAKPPYPYSFFEDSEAAQAWIEKHEP